MNDKDLELFVDNFNRSMDDYQLEHFVIKSQVTKYRQVQQSIIEYRSRQESLAQCKVELKRFDIERRKHIKNLDLCEDDLDKELIELEIQECEKNISFMKKRIILAERELKFFTNQIKKNFNSIEELEKFINDPEQERIYWIARMGKQAAMDMVSLGRISVGNMDSIAMMDEEDQIKTLQVAVQYSGLLNVGINKLQKEVIPYLQELESTTTKLFPTLENIEENLNVSLLNDLNNAKKSIQSSDKSESR